MYKLTMRQLTQTTLLAGMALVSSISMADPHQEHGNPHYNRGYDNNHQASYHSQHDRDERYHYRNQNRYYNDADYRQLPPGLQKNVERGKAVPPGWTKKLDQRYYSTQYRNGRYVYVINPDAYQRATVISRPRSGVVQIRLDNCTLEIIEATRAILNVF